MVLLRDQVRQVAFANAGFENPSWVAAQWGPVAVVTIGWMARLLARGGLAS